MEINVVNIGIARKSDYLKAKPAVIVLVEKTPKKCTNMYHIDQARILAKTLEGALPSGTLRELTDILKTRYSLPSR